MHVVVDSETVVGAASHIGDSADRCRLLAADLSALRHVSDSHVRAGLTELADVCADVLELVAIDLGLVEARLRAGAHLYSAVEGVVAGGLTSSGS